MFKILFNTILGLVLIFIWSRFVSVGQIISTIQTVNPVYLLPVFLFMLLSPIFRALRLKIFLSGIKKINLKDLIFLNGVAMMLNFLIPIRAGEIAKGIYLNTNYGLNLGKAIVWTFIDRFVDFLVVLFAATILLFFIPTSLNINLVRVLLSILITFLIMTYLLIFQLNLFKKIVRWLRYLLIEKHIKIYFDRLTSFILNSFSILNRHPKDLGLMFILTILAYGADAAGWYFTFIALRVPQGFIKMYLAILLSALTYLIPAAPGYIGSAEVSGSLILSGLFGINNNLASSMTVFFHGATLLFILIFGLVSIFSLKINLEVILKKALNRG